MFRLPNIFKEILLEETQNSKWKEIYFSTGGTPSTLQDIKIVPSAGGYCFKNPKNRFFYWRTSYDVLELIEHSLDTNLLNNQLRVRFEESPILDGITVYEKEENVILLIPTVSSVHKLIFRHPICDRSCDASALSIFSEFTLNNVRDPTLYSFFNTTPNLPHCGTSMLTSDNDAVFCLALSNGTILLFRLENQTGMTSSSYLKLDSGIPRLLSGLTEVFRSNKIDDNHVIIGLAMEEVENDIYVYVLSRSGQLRLFSASKATCLSTVSVVPTGSVLSIGAERNVIRKSYAGSELMLAVYVSLVEGSQILIIKKSSTADGVKLIFHSNIYTPVDHDLVEMITACGGEVVWCIWRSRVTGITMVSAVTVTSGVWSYCVSHADVNFVDNIDQIALDSVGPNVYYLDRIFEPGVFSATTISKVLNLIREHDPVVNNVSKLELRYLVYEAVEEEIAKTVSNSEWNTPEHLELAVRHWDRFYSNCVQYQENERQQYGLIWLQSCSLLIVITKSNLLFFRNMDVLEDDLVSVREKEDKNDVFSYRFLIDTLKMVEFSPDQKRKLYKKRRDGSILENYIGEIVAEIRLSNNFKAKVDRLLKYDDLPKALRKLCDILYMPETFESSDETSNLFKSDIGTKIVAASAKQIIQTRLDVSYKFAIVLSLLENTNAKTEFLSDVHNFCRAYSVLLFCSKSPIIENADMISVLELVLRKTDAVRQNMLLDSIWALCEHLWCLTNSKPLAEFFLLNGQYLLLEEYARLLKFNCGSWNVLLMQAYLEMNEPYKAFDIVCKEDDISSLLQIIEVFERYEHSHFIVKLAELAINRAGFVNSNLPTLYSICFMHHLKLQNFDEAYNSMENNPDEDRRTDCLRELIITLINMNAIDKLLEFPYNGLLTQLEDILQKRARSVGSQHSEIYYNFLYSFYIRHSNYRKAAIIMFEQAYRGETNELQKRCYASCINCLTLINPAHAWVLKPKSDANAIKDENCLDILELPQIYREYELASARCKLENCPSDSSVQNVINQLTKKRLFRNALKISSLFGLKLEPIFDDLVAVCVKLPDEQDPWKWLIANDVSDFSSVDGSNAVIVGWYLLENLLMKYEKPNLSTLHKAVVTKLLSLNVVLPYWLQLSYKKRNTSELLRLYLNFGAIEEAVKLGCGMIQSALNGNNCASFGIEKPLSESSSALCIPLNTLDLLLLELRDQKMDDYYCIVKENIEAYLNAAVTVTETNLSSHHLESTERWHRRDYTIGG